MTDDERQAKLREMTITFHYKEDSIPSIRGGRLTDDAIAQIDAVYREAGYVHVPEVEIVTRYERGKEPELFMVNGKEVMTGQEWYERFEREYHMSADWIAGDPEMGDDAEHDVLAAAKRAAGLEQS
jgi:hypothetical protein